MARESYYQTRIKKYLESKGALVLKYQAGPYTEKGIPDLFGVYKGMAFFVEVKVPATSKQKAGVLSKIQKFQIERIKQHGAIAIVCYGLDTELLDTTIERLDYRAKTWVNSNTEETSD